MRVYQKQRETYGLAQRPALANGNLVTLFNTECWRHMHSQVLVPLLVTSVLGDKVKIFTADDSSTVHLGRNDSSREDTATNRYKASKGALLVCTGG